MRARWIVAAFALLLAALPAHAQEQSGGPVMWLAYGTVKSGKTPDAVALTLEDAPFYEKALADGMILSWGMATPINHRIGDTWNHVMWVALKDWSKIDEWAAAFQRHTMSRSDEEREALKARFDDVFEAGSHFDEIVRHLSFVPRAAGQPVRYLYVGDYEARPGQFDAVTKIFQEYAQPIIEKLHQDGVLAGYGMYVSDLHGDDGWTHRVWYAMPDLGSVDKMMKAFRAQAQPGMQAWIDAAADMQAHSDQILLVLHIEDGTGE